MTDYSIARENMIESQVRPNGITDHRIIAALAGLAREDFVPESRRPVAYVDEDVELIPGRYLVEAMAFARLVQLAEIKPGDRVLHIGAGSGYGSAVLSQLAGSVTALECDSGLAAQARANLADRGNLAVVEGPLQEGWKAAAPYDVILIEGRAGEVPQAVQAQLANGGRLAAVVGDRPVAKAQLLTVHGDATAVRSAFDASVAMLPGLEAKRPAFVF